MLAYGKIAPRVQKICIVCSVAEFLGHSSNPGTGAYCCRTQYKSTDGITDYDI